MENTISLKQIRLLHRCFENRKASVSQDKTIFEWQQQHSAATPANWKLFNSITDTEGTLTILQSFFLSVLMKESLPLFIDFKEGRIQTGSESQTEFGFLRLLKFWKKWWIYLIQGIYLISFIPFFQQKLILIKIFSLFKNHLKLFSRFLEMIINIC